MLNVLWQLMEDDSDAEAKTLAELLRKHPELPDWSAAVQPVLDRLLHHSGITRPLACRVLSSMPFNALALSHRTVVIAESLVDFCRGQTHQMAFVVAHEVSHLYRGHARDRFSVGTVASMALTVNPMLKFGLKALLDRGCSRENEFEADRDAATFCHRAGYSASAGADFLQRISSGELPKNVVQQLLSTHPPIGERIAELQSHARRLFAAEA